MNIAQLLSDRAAMSGDLPAIIDNTNGTTRTFSFRQLESAASRLAAQLHTAGLRPGDAVLMLQPVSAELYFLFTALLRSGLVALFLDPSAGRHHIDQCCAVSPPQAFIGSARAHLLRFLSPALRRIPLKFSTDLPVPGARRLDYRRSSETRLRIEPCADDTPAIIRFTSGSTGRPKAAVRSHGYLQAQQRVLARSFALQAGTMDLVTMPMFVLSNLAAGVTSLIPHANLRAPGSVPPESLIREIHTHRPQRISAAPALLENLADACARQKVTLEGLQSVYTGGAPVFPRLLSKLRIMAPNAGLVAVYGSTEAEPIAVLKHHEISPVDQAEMAAGRGLLAGFPDQDIHLRIVRDDRTTDAPSLLVNQPVGDAGQIVVAGPHVQPNYLEDPMDGLTQIPADKHIWYQTGDSGFLDARGRLWLLGRCNARIEDARGILYPFQVEGMVLEDPFVRRAALFAHRNRRILAIEATHSIDTASLLARLKWAFIDTVQVLPRIPVDRRHNSKIDYPALRRMLDHG